MRIQNQQRHNKVPPVGSTVSWLGGTDEGSRVGKDEHAKGHPLMPKPSSSMKIDAAVEVSANQYLGILTKKKDNSISNITPVDEWIEIEVTVDSGACDTVMPASWCKGIAIVKSSIADGEEYEVANGESIPNLGERRCLLMTLGSTTAKKIVFQVADVHKPLLSISRCADMGFFTVFNKTGGYLEDQVTGERVPLERKENLYVMKAWVKRDPEAPPSPPSPFAGPV